MERKRGPRRTLRSPLTLLLWLFGFTLALWPARAADHPFLDLDFEAPECAGGWYIGGAGYESAVDATAPASGRQSLRLRYTRKAPWSEEAFGVASRPFPVADAAGKTIRLSGWIRTEAIASSGGHAGLWWRGDPPVGAAAMRAPTERNLSSRCGSPKSDRPAPPAEAASTTAMWTCSSRSATPPRARTGA